MLLRILNGCMSLTCAHLPSFDHLPAFFAHHSCFSSVAVVTAPYVLSTATMDALNTSGQRQLSFSAFFTLSLPGRLISVQAVLFLFVFPVFFIDCTTFFVSFIK